MKQFILSLLLALSTAVGYGQAQEVKINVHPGVELLTIVQKLSGKYPASAPSTYEREVLAYFSPYQKHPAVLKVQQLKRAGISRPHRTRLLLYRLARLTAGHSGQ
jgi:hypothetical protein